MDVLSYCSDSKSASILANLMASAKPPESAARKQCGKKKKKRKGMKKCLEKAMVERFWTDGKEKSCRYCRSSSASVEMTAYMAATLVMQGRLQEALKSIKWLGKQRNSQGGFVSTQDTVVALQAISLYSLRVSRLMNLNIKVNSKGKLLKKFSLNEHNKLLLQVLDKENKTACKLSIKIFCNFLFAENSFEQATKTNCCEGFRFWMCSRPNRPQVNMVVTILSRWRNPHITTFQNHRNIILACPRYNVEEMAEDSAFSMTTAFKDDNHLKICAKVCPAWDL